MALLADRIVPLSNPVTLVAANAAWTEAGRLGGGGAGLLKATCGRGGGCVRAGEGGRQTRVVERVVVCNEGAATSETVVTEHHKHFVCRCANKGLHNSSAHRVVIAATQGWCGVVVVGSDAHIQRSEL